jgi:hypothetical protein
MNDRNWTILAAAMCMTFAPLDTTGVVLSKSLSVAYPHLLTLKYRRIAVIISLSIQLGKACLPTYAFS